MLKALLSFLGKAGEIGIESGGTNVLPSCLRDASAEMREFTELANILRPLPRE